MSDFTSRIPARPSLEQLQKQAKELLRKIRAGDDEAAERFRAAGPRSDRLAVGYALADAQFVLARELGFTTWATLKQHIELLERPRAEYYGELAQDLVRACGGDEHALVRLHDVYGNEFTKSGSPFPIAALRAHVEERLGAIAGSRSLADTLTIDEARLFVARQSGFANWAKLLEHLGSGARPARGNSAAGLYTIDWTRNTIEVGPVVSSKDWDAIFGAMNEHGITGLRAGGRMTDAALGRLSKLSHVTRLDLAGSLKLTDAGLAHLVRMTRLRALDVSGWKGQITDQGLEVLRHLPELRRIEMCWQQNVSDAGIANLRCCEHIESVNLLGTLTGDGAIRALAGKSAMRRFQAGREVTDQGLGAFHEYPNFKIWQGGEVRYGLMNPDAGPTHLLVDGPFTDAGLARLAGLEGLFGLSFFWHCDQFTSKGLAALRHLPKLGFLGCQGERCDDEAMSQIAALPGLRMLMAQGTVASDAGFAALSGSESIEYIWGRECPHLTGIGFRELAAMPALRGLAVSCKHIDDGALV